MPSAFCQLLLTQLSHLGSSIQHVFNPLGNSHSYAHLHFQCPSLFLDHHSLSFSHQDSLFGYSNNFVTHAFPFMLISSSPL